MTGAQGYFDYWGKAGQGEACHLLAFHSLDVAAVAWQLLQPEFTWLSQVATLARCEPGSVSRTLPLLMALHDLGKFSDPFQAQRADIASELQGRDSFRSSRFRHDSLGWGLWQLWGSRKGDPAERDLHATLPLVWSGGSPHPVDSPELIGPWMAAITGHHGRPPDPQAQDDVRGSFGLEDIGGRTRFGRARWDALQFATGLKAEVFGAVDLEALATEPDERSAAFHRSSWWIAGFAILCDWLGSNTEFFPYQESPEALDTYFGRAKERAARAVHASGLQRVRARPSSRGALFPDLKALSPMQYAAEKVPLDAGPMLFVLEDLTGSGKTEAAMILANRILGADKCSGLFFALPTMATANAMHARLEPLVDRLFEGGASYVLAHSGPKLEGFGHLNLGSETDSHDGYGTREEKTATSTATAWLADNRKKALLATMGVGTIDQALLGALQSRHAALRLLGLAHHILIVDEVHACDAYMHTILCALLRMQAALGGSTILLSATLPLAQKQRLSAAFAEGLGSKPPPFSHHAGYPQWTSISSARAAQGAVDPRDGSPRSLPVVFHRSFDAVVERVLRAAELGHCVCWIRNTVGDALDAYDALAPRVDAASMTLFHARFAMGDRLRIERDVVGRFGPQSERASRVGRVVVATQVVEQSLDIDFDVLITDLCPIDLVIQRAGRLQRHRRQWSRPAPLLEIHAPPWTETPSSDWYAGPFRRSSYVYDNPGEVWRTAGELQRRGKLTLPEDARALVEAVFDTDAKIPEALSRRTFSAEGREKAQASVADMATVRLDQGYVRSGADWSPDARTPTRLGEPTMTLRLARVEAGSAPRAWADVSESRLRWPLSQLSVRRTQLCGVPEEDAALTKDLEATQPFVGDDTLTLILRPEADRWIGRGLAPEGREGRRPVRAVYSSLRGLELSTEGR